MDRVGDNGLGRLCSMFQQGVKVVGEAVPGFIRATKEKFSKIPSDCVSLMHSAEPLVRALVSSSDAFTSGKIFPEHPPVHIDDMFKEWSSERIDFVRAHCMKTLEECAGNGVTSIESSDKVFVARSELSPDISVIRAREFGFILPEGIDERMRCNPNLRIKPLIIRCFGVGSGSPLAQIQEGVSNVLALSADRLNSANTLVLSHIQSVQQRFEFDSNVLVVPFITGFSLGGMFASAIAVKNNITSMVFNGLGLGKGGCDFVGQVNWARAQQHLNSHIAMFVDHDFVASPDSPWRSVIRIPGRIFRIPRRETTKPTIAEMFEIHFYKKYFDQAYQEYLTPHPRAGGRLVA